MNQEVLIRVDEEGADDERVDSLATMLRDDLLALDVDDVRRPAEGEAPEGSRALELAAIGALLVSLKSGAEIVSSVVTTVREWLSRGASRRSVVITVGDKTLTLDSASPAQQDRIIDEFLRGLAAE